MESINDTLSSKNEKAKEFVDRLKDIFEKNQMDFIVKGPSQSKLSLEQIQHQLSEFNDLIDWLNQNNLEKITSVDQNELEDCLLIRQNILKLFSELGNYACAKIVNPDSLKSDAMRLCFENNLKTLESHFLYYLINKNENKSLTERFDSVYIRIIHTELQSLQEDSSKCSETLKTFFRQNSELEVSRLFLNDSYELSVLLDDVKNRQQLNELITEQYPKDDLRNTIRDNFYVEACHTIADKFCRYLLSRATAMNQLTRHAATYLAQYHPKSNGVGDLSMKRQILTNLLNQQTSKISSATDKSDLIWCVEKLKEWIQEYETLESNKDEIKSFYWHASFGGMGPVKLETLDMNQRLRVLTFFRNIKKDVFETKPYSSFYLFQQNDTSGKKAQTQPYTVNILKILNENIAQLLNSSDESDDAICQKTKLLIQIEGLKCETTSMSLPARLDPIMNQPGFKGIKLKWDLLENPPSSEDLESLTTYRDQLCQIYAFDPILNKLKNLNDILIRLEKRFLCFPLYWWGQLKANMIRDALQKISITTLLSQDALTDADKNPETIKLRQTLNLQRLSPTNFFQQLKSIDPNDKTATESRKTFEKTTKVKVPK